MNEGLWFICDSKIPNLSHRKSKTIFHTCSNASHNLSWELTLIFIQHVNSHHSVCSCNKLRCAALTSPFITQSRQLLFCFHCKKKKTQLIWGFQTPQISHITLKFKVSIRDVTNLREINRRMSTDSFDSDQ